MKVLKKVVIWEDLVELTDDYRDAAILSQLLYWLPRMKDTDTYLAAERERMARNGMDSTLDLSDGWIYKTAEELSEETMMGLAVSTIRKCLQRLVDSGWVQQRHNPKYKWDRTWQYRVNLVRLERDLGAMGKGYTLAAHGIVLNATDGNAFSCGENANACGENGFSTSGNRSAKSNKSNFASKKTIPDSTTESTPESTVRTNNKQESVVVEDVRRSIESILGLSVETLTDLPTWVYTYGTDYLIQKAEIVVSNPPKGGWKNVVGAYRAAVLGNWRETSSTEQLVEGTQAPSCDYDIRYHNYYLACEREQYLHYCHSHPQYVTQLTTQHGVGVLKDIPGAKSGGDDDVALWS